MSLFSGLRHLLISPTSTRMYCGIDSAAAPVDGSLKWTVHRSQTDCVACLRAVEIATRPKKAKPS